MLTTHGQQEHGNIFTQDAALAFRLALQNVYEPFNIKNLKKDDPTHSWVAQLKVKTTPFTTSLWRPAAWVMWNCSSKQHCSMGLNKNVGFGRKAGWLFVVGLETYWS